MNLIDLYKKIYTLDTIKESSEISECDCTNNVEQPHKQQDSLTMNVSINGQGSNGIRDLMDILRNIDNKTSDNEITTSSPEPIKISSDEISNDDEPEIIKISSDDQHEESELEPQFGDPEEIVLGSSEETLEDQFKNSMINGSDKNTLGVVSLIAAGTDLANKGHGAPKANGGENPWNVSESLVKHLSDLYQTVKNKSLNETRDLPG